MKFNEFYTEKLYLLRAPIQLSFPRSFHGHIRVVVKDASYRHSEVLGLQHINHYIMISNKTEK